MSKCCSIFITVKSVLKIKSSTTHLGTPGGARLGREGTWGGGPLKGSGEAPGLDGTGGAPAERGPGAVRPPGRGGPGGALRWGVGLDIGDLFR